MIDVIFAAQPKWAASLPTRSPSSPSRCASPAWARPRSRRAWPTRRCSNGVIADYRGGETLGVNSTPSLFINGELFKGARSVEELDAAFGKLAK